MEKKLVIQFGEYQIVAEIYDVDPNAPPELWVHVRDKDDCIVQNICTISPWTRYNLTTGEFETINNYMCCRVWGNSLNGDYTDRYIIGVYKEGEEE